ncbi:MAG: acetylxylan esterase [Rariglobus sp.]
MNVNLARPYSPPPSRPRSSNVTFSAPAAPDFLFQPGLQTRVICHPALRGLDLVWELCHNFVKAPLRTGTVPVSFDNSFVIDLPLHGLAPGFYDVRVTINVTATLSLTATTTVGWRVNDLVVHTRRPADFDAFWAAAHRLLDDIPLTASCTLERVLQGPEIEAYNITSASLPENYDPSGIRAETVEIYRVRFSSYGQKKIEGWFTKPTGPGPFPALLVFPGAGNNARPAPVEHARHGYAALDIQVHGNPVDAADYTKVLPESPDHPQDFRHYGIYLHALQASRALKQLPSVDGTRLAVIGGSQGGRLALVVAALEPSIKAAVPAITNHCYLPWLNWTKRLNQAGESGCEKGFTGDTAEACDETLPERYLDVVHFASLVRCPVLMNNGLIDPVSSPTGVQAAYLGLRSPKQLITLATIGHDWSPAFDRHAWRWLDDVLKTTTPPPKSDQT